MLHFRQSLYSILGYLHLKEGFKAAFPWPVDANVETSQHVWFFTV